MLEDLARKLAERNEAARKAHTESMSRFAFLFSRGDWDAIDEHSKDTGAARDAEEARREAGQDRTTNEPESL